MYSSSDSQALEEVLWTETAFGLTPSPIASLDRELAAVLGYPTV